MQYVITINTEHPDAQEILYGVAQSAAEELAFAGTHSVDVLFTNENGAVDLWCIAPE